MFKGLIYVRRLKLRLVYFSCLLCVCYYVDYNIVIVGLEIIFEKCVVFNRDFISNSYLVLRKSI